ncbi:MAG: hypothetical protein IJU07_00895, partial [Synergistaceae bacterium]|nr:hypothetical protein [Synergistaceae bacterium]
LSTVNIPLGQKIDAHATTRVDYQCNLDSRSSNFLSYGFADLPFNAVAGAKGLNGGAAKIPMNGTDYDLSIQTSFDATANATDTGINYLAFSFVNGGETTALTFDMTNIDETTGLPNLTLPYMVENPTDTGYDAASPSANIGDNGLVGWINIATGAVYNGSTGHEYPSLSQDELNRNYAAVYQFPGQTPPQYFVAQYDDDTGVMKMRNITFDGSSTSAGLVADIESGAVSNLKIGQTVFTYDVKGKMDYTNFTLSGAPSIATASAGDEGTENVQQEFNFIVEFHESDVTQSEPSSLGKTMSKMTLWYYGYSNGDDPSAGTATQIQDGTVPDLSKSMHKLEANVFFNADGSFDSVEWDETNNTNAPLGFRILTEGGVGPNFQIVPAASTSAGTKSDAINFMVAQTLDDPSPTDQLGSWTPIGASAQGGYHATKATIYDDNGNTHTLEVTYKKVTENRWRWEAFIVEQDESGNDIISNIVPEPKSGEIKFDGSGRIDNAIADGALRSTQNAEVAITLPFSLNGQPNSTVTLNFGGGVGQGGDVLLGVTQFASETTTKPVYQDGYTMDILKNYSIAANGTVTGSYTNGVSIPLYRVALATFANEQGL